MVIQPTNGNLILKKILTSSKKFKEKTRFSFEESEDFDPTMYEVDSITYLDDYGMPMPKPGDWVVIKKNSGVQFNIGNSYFMLLKIEDIGMIINFDSETE